ncbi:hypothetical protein [Asticcacaulis sp. EMRT-3]|uniref:hypothetical protein n=1 Tax=Asticcacaulis sp. EMRT-3 TaxID=3040349 RepID=UPI0024AFA00B|nr:hypothetical protein [Asticcacaulis sp. EMRT-3]MDI7774726.1 hypothetical protein [Asticcacaulis sp. EMRT-3]
MTLRLWAVLGLVMLPGLALPGIALAAVTSQPLPVAKPAILLPDSAQATTTQYDPGQGFPDRKGALSGMVIVIPQQEVAVFGKGDDADRQIDRVSRAEAGADLAIKLVFTGVKADDNGVANLTYDVEVLGPDGKIYGKSDYKGLLAMIGQAGPGDGAVYDNQRVVLMQFEPQDMPGTYTVKAVLHDRIARIDLPMQTTVELLPPRSATPAPVAGEATSAAAASATATSAAAVQAPAAKPATKKTVRKHHRRR